MTKDEDGGETVRLPEQKLLPPKSVRIGVNLRITLFTDRCRIKTADFADSTELQKKDQHSDRVGTKRSGCSNRTVPCWENRNRVASGGGC